MPKLKTHKGTAKRIKSTKNGKLLYRKAGTNHFLSKKSSSRKRSLSLAGKLTGKIKQAVKRLLNGII